MEQYQRLVPRPKGKTIIKTKWIFKNKKDESSLVIRNKARLVAVRYSQQEGIDYDETFAPVAKIEAIRLFLAYAAHKDFTVFQMDVKTTFLNEILKEKVYVGQTLSFISTQYPNHVYALDKALYGLKQAAQAWYDVLSHFLIDSGFQKGSIDTTLFIKKKGKHIMLIQVYVDDIIFSSTNPKYCIKFSNLIVKHFEISMMGEMKLFLALQVNKFSNGIFINQSKYILDILKRFGIENYNTVPTPMVEQVKLKLDLVGKPVDHTNYRSMIGSLISIEPANVAEALRDANWSVIKTKWIFKNKKDESSLVIRNKARLVAVGYSQQEGIDYDETFAPVTRIEAIRLFLAYAHKDFTVFQMDVKTAFLNE
nr:retrovirus-related Pol polyprotein from transposon TNT 1-94 [Tanacetum cinerariifolium]